MSFTKHDTGKLRFDLTDEIFEEELVRVLMHGAAKYTDDNWKKAEPEEAKKRYYAACRRHLSAWASGELSDNESGLPHLMHAACCLLFLRWYEREYATNNE